MTGKKKLEAVIGLEIHLQLKTKSKMFCSCQASDFGSPPNTSVCPICLGHPGTLPVVNRAAVEQGLKLALALNLAINRISKFDRKNYFYPDLPKGYQITQFNEPLAENGHLLLQIAGQDKRFNIERLHLEEDAGKNIHSGGSTLVDFNRAGIPLAEIVTKPDFRDTASVKRFLQELQLIARYLGASDADMEKGHLRCDANVSLRPVGDVKLYAKTEVKNMNSFRSVERALGYEIKRQTQLWQQGQPPAEQTTRGWNDSQGLTELQRSKEESNDYRYFPEPDLPPLSVTVEEINHLREQLPELPEAKRLRFSQEYQLKYNEAEVLVADLTVADYFEQVMSEVRDWLLSSGEVEGSEEEIWQAAGKKLSRLVFSWLTTELFKHLNANHSSIADVKITAENFAEFIVLIHQSKVNSSAAQTIFAKMFETGSDPTDIVDDLDLHQESDETKISVLVETVLAANQPMVEQYKNGKTGVLQYLVGQVMKESKGKANPQMIGELIKKQIA